MIKEKINNGIYDEKFSELYPAEDVSSGKCSKRLIKLLDTFMTAFTENNESNVTVFSSPGRAELVGNHTDHQGGKVLTAALTLDTLACAVPAEKVTIYSEGYGTFSVETDDLSPREDEKNTPQGLVRGVLRYFSDCGFSVGGFNACITSDVPEGAGLSSSASFSVLVAVILDHFYKNTLSVYDITLAAKFAENVYFGKACGLMDQTAIALGGINFIDFSKEKPEHRAIDFNFEKHGCKIFVTDTGSSHAGLSEDFDAIPAEMSAVAKALGGEHLCDISENEFWANVTALRGKCGDRAILRAMHLFEECRRVEEAASALSSYDLDTFLELAGASGRSSFMYLQNISSYKEPSFQPLALALAASDKHLGAGSAFRVHGGGFAGSIIAFVPNELADYYRKEMNKIFGENSCTPLFIRKQVAGVVIP